MSADTQTAERQAELAELRATVRDVARDAGGLAAARRRSEAGSGYDIKAWDFLGAQMGLAGLGLPEELGGAGGGLAELTSVAEELGRVLLPVPFLSSSVFAGQVLARCAAPAAEVIEGLASGQALGGLAMLDPDGCWRVDGVGVTAVESAGRWKLSGHADFVLDGMDATYLIVTAATDSGLDLYLVDVAADGVVRRPMETLDLARGQCSVAFTDAAGSPLTTDGAGAQIADAAWNASLVVLAAEQVGGASGCLEMAVEYAKIRRQFSRPIGGFQSIKHKLADLLVLVEMARSSIDRALLVEDDPVALAEAAAVAQAWCSEAFVTVAAEGLHIHGGVGFTWEHDSHLYFRRAFADAALGGGADYHRERIATLLGW